ncbi:MAG: fatty acid desaturase [Psychrobacter sp.]|nr:fatty acid desaturase [Psychrobacter sp.]
MITKIVTTLPKIGMTKALQAASALINAAGAQTKRFQPAAQNQKASPSLATESAAKVSSAKAINPSTQLNANLSTNPEVAEWQFRHAPINWIPAAVLIATPLAAAIITPWYLATHKVSAPVWGVFGAFMVWTGMSITGGYHRLMAHRAYKAHPIVRNFFLLGATLAVQGSAFDWCAGHRIHHRHVDDPIQDPYSAKRGFWFSHIGWMLREYPSGQFDYKNIPDLTKDKILQIQHKYYGLWVLATNVGLVAAVGWLLGDVWGTLVLAGLLRLVLTHHFTFFINSLCHMFGSRPYTDTNTARDNFFLALFTWGEGYHNYHHFFQYDFRNGVKWWQYDPTKWLIAAFAKLGLASELRTVDDLTIKHAEVQMQFKQAQESIEALSQDNPIEVAAKFHQFKDRIKFEYGNFMQTVEEWKALKTKAVEMKKTDFANRLHEVDEVLKQDYARIEQQILMYNHNLKRAFREVGYHQAS